MSHASELRTETKVNDFRSLSSSEKGQKISGPTPVATPVQRSTGHGLLFLQKNVIDVLVLNFKAMFLARVKVRKKDFCIVWTENSKGAVTEHLYENLSSYQTSLKISLLS